MMIEGHNYGSYRHGLAGAPPKELGEKTVKELQDEVDLGKKAADIGTAFDLNLERLGVKKKTFQPTADPIATLISEADGYAASLITAGALTQADYDTQKATAKGAGWTIATAMAFRDAVKKALDDYNAKQGGAMGWLLPVGIAAVAFLALRK
jgi:hypothetical protein